MSDVENTPEVQEVAPQGTEAQNEQVDSTDKESITPEAQQETEATDSDKEEKKERLYAGKFKSAEDLEKSYQELQSEFTRKRQSEKEIPQYQPQPEIPKLDPDAEKAVEHLLEQKLEAKRVQEFVTKHQEELKDPLLSGTTQRIIAEANARGEYVSQEDALNQAKQMLDERIQTSSKKATQEGVIEGQKVAQAKNMAGAIGSTKVSNKVDPNTLSAKEFAKYYGLKINN